MINKNFRLYSSLCIALFAMYSCSHVSMVEQPDLYESASENIAVDLTSTPDNGFKEPIKKDGWELVWSDEFAGTEIDSTKWTHEVNGDGGGNNELQYYTASKANSYIIDKKYLVLKAIKQNYKGKFYTSGRLNTRYKHGWTYGRFDIRAKTPVQQGVWPAIWMLPTDYVYGTWPQSGEIDIMESIGHQPKTCYGTIHFGQPWPNNSYKGEHTDVAEGDLSTAFHVYSVEWEPKEIRWYLDGVLYSTKKTTDTDPHRWPFDQTFHMILNLAIGGQWPGPPDESTTFPKYMFVDYVRVYKKP
ncbi:MAG: glycoside hydrolase family 16 protein [Bacteroidetes bacterium]|nr:glycoside hydrolase family 16 protein [Bacteroidota bacterium]